MNKKQINEKLRAIESKYYNGHNATSTDISDWWFKQDQKEYKRLLRLLRKGEDKGNIQNIWQVNVRELRLPHTTNRIEEQNWG